MITVKARNAQQALPEMMHQLRTHPLAIKGESRNGPVIRFMDPLTIQYTNPLERVVYWPERDANPFFHLFESLWMLMGRNDVAYVKQYSSQMGQFSDDGQTFHGAYGHRWRAHFGFDQLYHIAEALRKDPNDRRQVLAMWDANVDGNGRTGKDFPCNIDAVFNRDHLGRLNMVVYNRSNDILWGALGANCVHFSVLQEYLAAMIGCPVGQYWQVSANMHGYTELANGLLGRCLPLADYAFPSQRSVFSDPYEQDAVDPFPLVNRPIEEWNQDLLMFMSNDRFAFGGYHDPFFRRLAVPLALAYEAFSNRENPNRFAEALEIVSQVRNCDWKLACHQWLVRRWNFSRTKAQVAAA